MKSYLGILENYATSFSDGNNWEEIFVKEDFVTFDKSDKIQINFTDCHVAICPNGGLIAICKKKNYLDIKKNSKINKNIIVMFQNVKQKYYIPIDWSYEKMWVVYLDFNEKEQLYAICNNGQILKIDILLKKAVQKCSCQYFKCENQNIVKAKFVENGFIALTNDGEFYYLKDIKNPVRQLFFPINLLNFSKNVEFLPIPSSVSRSQKLELLIINEKGTGVVHIEQSEQKEVFSFVPVENSKNEFQVKGASIIKRDKIEPFITTFDIDDNKNKNKNIENQNSSNLGNIKAMAISPDKKKIAFYDQRGIIFIFSSDFSSREEVKLTLDDKIIKKEQQDIFKYEKGSQFLFCGTDSIALCGQKYIFIINHLQKRLTFSILDESDIDEAKLNQNEFICKCISEIDGLRCLSNKGIFFISRISQDLYNICNPFSSSKLKQIITFYEKVVKKENTNEKEIRDLKERLPIFINQLQNAAADLFWTKKEDDSDKKNGQMILLETAQYIKGFLKREKFDYDEFYNLCRTIRIINNLRIHPKKPKLITYREYLSIKERIDLIQKLMRIQNFGLAFKISQYLEDEIDIRMVYEKYAINCIKEIGNQIDADKEEDLFHLLNDQLVKVEGFSFFNLAKKAFKYKKDKMGLQFLNNEKSKFAKIPKYIDKNEWGKILSLCENIFDTRVLKEIFDKIMQKISLDEFVPLFGKHPKLKPVVIEYIKRKKPEKVEEYLEYFKNPEELFFLYLEQYFQSSKIERRKKYITKAKKQLDLIDSKKTGFDSKFYKNYLESLEPNISFKLECLTTEKGKIIKSPEKTNFDISIYDVYKMVVKAERYPLVEKKNDDFNFSNEGLALMRLGAYAENEKVEVINAFIKKGGNLNKLNLKDINVAEVYYNLDDYTHAGKYLKNVNDKIYMSYKIDLLQNMKDVLIAVEVIILDKNFKHKEEFIQNLISGKPKMVRPVKELAEKLKFNLQLE